MQVEQDKEQLGPIAVEKTDAYSLFLYAVRSRVTRDYYLRRLRLSLIILVYFQQEQWKIDVIYLHQREKGILAGDLVAL
jgi:hypothetical protein